MSIRGCCWILKQLSQKTFRSDRRLSEAHRPLSSLDGPTGMDHLFGGLFYMILLQGRTYREATGSDRAARVLAGELFAS